MQILEDVGLLGKGVLIMSGHDDEFHPDNIPPSPALTISTQGAIPSAPMTPNLTIEGERTVTANLFPVDGAKSPTSPPTSPSPSSPNNNQPTRGRSSISGRPTIPALVLPPTLTTDSTVFKAPPTLAPVANLDSTNLKRSTTPSRKTSRFGSPNSTVRQGSVIHITNVQEASQVVADSKYHDTLVVLEVNFYH